MSKQEIDDMSDFFRQRVQDRQRVHDRTQAKTLGNSGSSTVPTKTQDETCTNICDIATNNKLNRVIDLLSDISDSLQSFKPRTEKKFFSTAQTAVSVSTATRPENPDVIAGATGYDRVRVADILGHISTQISVINDGNASIFVIASSDGKTWSSDENPILVGEAREFYNVYELRIRSPTAGNLTTLQGGIYRVTEYQYSLAYTSTTTFNRADLEIQSVQNVAMLGQQLPNIVVPNGFALVIRATQGNVGSIYVATTQARTQAAATRGTLLAGDTLELYITNANLVFVASSTGAEDVDLVVEQ